jgi:hypothetical protein
MPDRLSCLHPRLHKACICCEAFALKIIEDVTPYGLAHPTIVDVANLITTARHGLNREDSLVEVPLPGVCFEE